MTTDQPYVPLGERLETVDRNLARITEDVLWLRLKATHDHAYEALDPVKAHALATAVTLWAHASYESEDRVLNTAARYERWLRNDTDDVPDPT